MSKTLAVKYRPTTFSEVLGQSHMGKVLRDHINTQKVRPAYLFAGQHGSGKCIALDTRIYTDRGILPLGDMYPKWREASSGSYADVSVSVAGEGGVKQATQFYFDGLKVVRRVWTVGGLFLCGTEPHRIRVWVGDKIEWMPLGEVKAGVKVAVPVGTNLWGREGYSQSMVEPKPTWSREGFMKYLHYFYKAHLIRRPDGLRLRANSVGSAEMLRLQVLNLGFMCNIVIEKTSCCAKAFVVVAPPGAERLEKYILTGNPSALQVVPFYYGVDEVDRFLVARAQVADLVVPDGNAFCSAGFMSHNTTTARIYARGLLCETPQNGDPCNKCKSCVAFFEERNPNFREVDAASTGLVEDVHRIKEDARYSPVGAKWRVLLMDESQRMSPQAQSAMLKFVEEGIPNFTVMFATTDPEKMSKPLRSRCVALNILRIAPSLIRERLEFVCDQESVTADSGALELIVRHTGGHVRDALMKLEEVSALGPVTVESVSQYLQLDLVGSYYEILRVLPGDVKKAFGLVEALLGRVDGFHGSRGLAGAALEAYSVSKGVKLPSGSMELTQSQELVKIYGEKLLVLVDLFSGMASGFSDDLLYCRLFQARQLVAGLEGSADKGDPGSLTGRTSKDLMTANLEANLRRKIAKNGETPGDTGWLPSADAVIEVLTWGLKRNGKSLVSTDTEAVG